MDNKWREDFERRLYAEFSGTTLELLLALMASNDWRRDSGDEILGTFVTVNGDVREPIDGGDLEQKLYHHFIHQNTRYLRSLQVVPFLSEMLPHVSAHNQISLIMVLLEIALGYPAWHLQYGFVPTRAAGAYMTEQEGVAMHQSVQRHAFAEFLKLANIANNSISRPKALYALAWFPDHEAESSPLLWAAAEKHGLAGRAALFALVQLEKARCREAQLPHLDDWDDPPQSEADDFDDLFESLMHFDEHPNS